VYSERYPIIDMTYPPGMENGGGESSSWPKKVRALFESTKTRRGLVYWEGNAYHFSELKVLVFRRRKKGKAHMGENTLSCLWEKKRKGHYTMRNTFTLIKGR